MEISFEDSFAPHCILSFLTTSSNISQLFVTFLAVVSFGISFTSDLTFDFASVFDLVMNAASPGFFRLSLEDDPTLGGDLSFLDSLW